VLASWNGLAIGALARGARVLGEPALADAALRAADFVWTTFRDSATGELFRRWRGGEAALAGQLDDYAYVARGFLELYATTFDAKWLERAVARPRSRSRCSGTKRMARSSRARRRPARRVRMKDGFDGAELAGNSIAAANLVRLSELLSREDWQVKAQRSLDYYARGSLVVRGPCRRCSWPWTSRRTRAPHRDRGEPSPGRDALLAVTRSRFRPFDDVVVVDDRLARDAGAPGAVTAGLRPSRAARPPSCA